MTDLQIRLLRTHDEDIFEYVSPLVDQLLDAAPPEITVTVAPDDGALAEEDLVNELYAVTVRESNPHYCLLFETAPPSAEEADEVVRLDAWLQVPAALMPESLADLVYPPTLVLVPAYLSEWPIPRCDASDAAEDQGFLLPPNNSGAFDPAQLADYVDPQHVATTGAVQGNCRIDGACPGILGCWTPPKS